MIYRALATTEVQEINVGKRPVSKPFLEVHPVGVKNGPGGDLKISS
ncbi:MAG: hypothetical protein HOC91_16085 [Nitrospinaceae bacterium]|nr:hypothetical protein [Nitrospinaceae bacterium]MBT4094563.1 hypothetical protein [Nitrospinaceae bacterium]MBT4432029.1 hypothetical protein [Nitrospinaceae bacterium]MBT5367373.1 hypothetical protein [Nitrospinaceae bacterium]MBT5947315.1 hypothetical protein [Nitrospinaceae bacterium]